MPTFTFNITRTNEVKETLIEASGVGLKLDFFWNSHGRRINWNKSVDLQKSYKSVDIRLERYSFTETYEYSGSHDFETLRLYINGTLVEGDVFKWTWWEDEDHNPLRYNFKIDCGWG